VAICPENAIQHLGMNQQNFIPIDKPQPNGESMQQFLASLRSERNYLPKPIDPDLIKTIVNAGANAPTAKNRQWRYFLVITDPTMIQKIERITMDTMEKLLPTFGFLQSFFGKWLMRDDKSREFIDLVSHDINMASSEAKQGSSSMLHNPPCLILTYAWHNTGANGDRFAEQHCILAQTYMMMQAYAMGLACCINGYVLSARKKITALVELPKNHTIYGAMTLGYPRYTYKKAIQRIPPTVRWI